MQITGSAELPLLSELLTTVSQIGDQATMNALINARNKGVDLDDPIIQQVINATIEELAISFEQLIAKRTRTLKKRHGLIIVSYCLTRLKYSQVKTGVILGGRSRSQINRYHKVMSEIKGGKLLTYRNKFEELIKSLKLKNKKHGQRKRTS